MGNSSQQDPSDNAADDDAGGENTTNVLEWIVGILGMLIVGSTVVYLIIMIIGGVGDPPLLRVALGDPIDHGHEIIVPVTVENEGGSVAADAIIEVCDATQTCAHLTFNYVPHASERTGKVGFNKPLQEPLTMRVVSYIEP